jgi:hypothetical protein
MALLRKLYMGEPEMGSGDVRQQGCSRRGSGMCPSSRELSDWENDSAKRAALNEVTQSFSCFG